MAPRLKGRALQLALRAADTRVGASALRQLAFREYEMERLMALPVDMLDPLGHEPRPVQGAQARQWQDARAGTPPTAPGRVSARDLRAAYLAGETTPSEVLRTIYAREDAGDFGHTVFSPFVTLNTARAERAAAESSARYAAGESLGPLDGIPVPIKDEVDLAGLPTFGGTAF